MALAVFLRGVNVGGHRTFRPSLLAKELSAFDVVNIGAAGTFVVRKPGSAATFTDALRRKLPFQTEIILCEGEDLLRLEREHRFSPRPPEPRVVRFVSILSKAGGAPARLPVHLPPEGDWLVRLIAVDGRYVYGEYRRHMKTITYLGQVDKQFGCVATTRNWNTLMSIVKVLEAADAPARGARAIKSVKPTKPAARKPAARKPHAT
jgi:uncharacterized protein (DUF1697 family)